MNVLVSVLHEHVDMSHVTHYMHAIMSDVHAHMYRGGGHRD